MQVPCWGKGLSEATLFLGEKHIPDLNRSRHQPGRLCLSFGWGTGSRSPLTGWRFPPVSLSSAFQAHSATPGSRSIPSTPGQLHKGKIANSPFPPCRQRSPPSPLSQKQQAGPAAPCTPRPVRAPGAVLPPPPRDSPPRAATQRRQRHTAARNAFLPISPPAAARKFRRQRKK